MICVLYNNTLITLGTDNFSICSRPKQIKLVMADHMMYMYIYESQLTDYVVYKVDDWLFKGNSYTNTCQHAQSKQTSTNILKIVFIKSWLVLVLWAFCPIIYSPQSHIVILNNLRQCHTSTAYMLILVLIKILSYNSYTTYFIMVHFLINLEYYQ